MDRILGVILKYVGLVVPVLPSLISSIETLWKGQPKAGSAKWIAIEQALSQTITTVAGEIQQIAPAGTDPNKVSASIAKFTKAVNDSLVTLFNELGIFTTS